MKHRVKIFLREAWARTLWHTGLHRLVDRMSRQRLLILYGHCVEDPEVNGDLAPEMKLPEARLEQILRTLGKRYDLVTIAEGMARLRSKKRGRSMVALSMDDGYVDNLTRLVPLLERVDGKATVFLEAGPVVERRLGWLHTFEWLVARSGVGPLAARLEEGLGAASPGLPVDDAGRLKRALKYDVRPDLRDGLLARFLREQTAEAGTSEAALVDRLYLDADGARRLAASERIEVGGHTVEHPVLSRIGPDRKRAEIEGGRQRLSETLGGGSGETFAYPYGRGWDFDDASVEAVRAAGYRYAVTTHAGVNTAASDPYRLRRWPIEASTPLHLLGVEAAGGFELLRRVKLDLVESRRGLEAVGRVDGWAGP